MRALVEWRRKTLEAKHGLPYGLEYTLTEGTAELDDYRWFFHPTANIVSPPLALRPERRSRARHWSIIPAAGIDIWNSRYFILPFYPRWSGAAAGDRGLPLRFPELVAPVAGDGTGTGAAESDPDRWKEWVKREDWQVLRNRAALPRAWSGPRGAAVAARRNAFTPTAAPGPDQGDPLPRRRGSGTKPGTSRFYDPRATAWVETDDLPALNEHLPGGRASDSRERERAIPGAATCRARGPGSTRPGLVVLSDVYYPDWRLSIDGRPACIVSASMA